MHSASWLRWQDVSALEVEAQLIGGIICRQCLKVIVKFKFEQRSHCARDESAKRFAQFEEIEVVKQER